MSASAPTSSGRPDASTGLRIRTARGTIVNAVFLTSINTLALLRGFLGAAFLTNAEYGVWGVVLVLLLRRGSCCARDGRAQLVRAFEAIAELRRPLALPRRHRPGHPPLRSGQPSMS